jgi:hypothetical protein
MVVDPAEHIGEPGARIDIVEFGSDDERVHGCGPRRRLSDRVEAVFQAACMTGDLDTAADLLTVLGNMRERGRRAFGDERRISDDPVAKAQKELVTRRLVKPQLCP